MGRCRNPGLGRTRGLTGVAHDPRSQYREYRRPGVRPSPAGGNTTVAETDDTIAIDALPPAEPTDSGDAGRRHRPRWPIALVLVWAVLAVTDLAVFHSRLNTGTSPTSQTVATGAGAHRHTQATAPAPAPKKSRAPVRAARAARVLAPVSASAFGPAGPGSGDDPQSASLAIDASKATAWTTDWYRTARFGGLQAGTGLLITMGQPVTITSARITLGSASGADLQLRTGKSPALTRMRLQASASDAGGTVHLTLARPHRARYLLIWFTQLPPDPAGTFKASVYDVRLKGYFAAGPSRAGAR